MKGNYYQRNQTWAVVLTAKYANGAEWVQPRAFQEVGPIINLAFSR